VRTRDKHLAHSAFKRLERVLSCQELLTAIRASARKFKFFKEITMSKIEADKGVITQINVFTVMNKTNILCRNV
jgi:hypothetical protein